MIKVSISSVIIFVLYNGFITFIFYWLLYPILPDDPYIREAGDGSQDIEDELIGNYNAFRSIRAGSRIFWAFIISLGSYFYFFYIK